MKKILVTGASGFIGTHLIKRLLQDGFSVRALVFSHFAKSDVSSHVEVVQGDIRDAQFMKEAARDIDTVFHLAGRAHALSEIQQEDSKYHAINVQGTRNLLEAARHHGVQRFIFFSSVKVMGEETEGCVDESAEPHPLTAYGRSKLEAEKLVLNYGERYGFHAVCLRLSLVYGEGNKGNLTRMIQAVDRGFFPPLQNITSYRSMVHVSNVVEAAILASQKSQANGMCYIVADVAPYATFEIYEMILRALGRDIPRWHIPLKILRFAGLFGDCIGRLRGRRFIFDSEVLKKMTDTAWYSPEKISRDLGFRPTLTIQQTLPEIINWCRRKSL